MRLPQRVPYHLAMEWALSGELIEARRAYEVSLVNRLTPSGAAVEGALELARKIAANGPLAVAATKQIIIEAPSWPAAEMFDRQREISVPVRESEDAREGATAFKEKRAPRWRGV
jgi:enoyl-CoA hydratase